MYFIPTTNQKSSLRINNLVRCTMLLSNYVRRHHSLTTLSTRISGIFLSFNFLIHTLLTKRSVFSSTITAITFCKAVTASNVPEKVFVTLFRLFETVKIIFHFHVVTLLSKNSNLLIFTTSPLLCHCLCYTRKCLASCFCRIAVTL